MHAVFILTCISLVVVYLYKRSFEYEQFLIQIFIALVFISIDANRRDRKFILYLKEKGKYIVLSEYVSLVILIELPYCFTGKIDRNAVIPFITILIILLSSYRLKKITTWMNLPIIKTLSTFLPLHAFEWRSGIRKNRLFFCLSYIIGMATLFLFPITPLIMLFWVSFSGEFYNVIENKDIIQSYDTFENFGNRKLKSFFTTLNVVFLPHYLLYIILYHEPEQLIILLFAIVLFNMIFTYAFFYKYKFAMTSQRQVYNSFPLLVFMCIVLIAPLSIYFIFNLWKNIRTTLKLYLK